MDVKFLAGRRQGPCGKIADLPEVELAAQAYALGIPEGQIALTSSDPVELMLLNAVVQRAFEVRKVLDDHLAVKIAERVGQLFNG